MVTVIILVWIELTMVTVISHMSMMANYCDPLQRISTPRAGAAGLNSSDNCLPA